MKQSKEAIDELNKNSLQQIQDIIDEAKTLPTGPAGEKENLDIIKHLIKRLAYQQVSFFSMQKLKRLPTTKVLLQMRRSRVSAVLAFIGSGCRAGHSSKYPICSNTRP